ncbi:hypothetical protein GW17_00053203, partial [Ensete ventricosum]
GIGNGIPIGAVVTTPEIAQVLTQRSYFNTFGGNPVCTAAGHAVLKVIEKNVAVIGDVRGRGLMLGVELVTDRQQKTPAKTEIMHDMGVLVGKGGFYGNVFRITPPLCFSKEDAGMCIYALALLSVPVLSLEWCMSNVLLQTSSWMSWTLHYPRSEASPLFLVVPVTASLETLIRRVHSQRKIFMMTRDHVLALRAFPNPCM